MVPMSVTVYLCWMAIGSLLSTLLFLAGCLCGGYWKYLDQHKFEERLRSENIKSESVRMELLDLNDEGTYTFYLTKSGTKVHLTERCSGLSQSHDRKTIQERDLCHLCLDKLVKIKNH